MAAVADSWEEMEDAHLVEERLKKLEVSTSRKSPGPADGHVSVVVQDDSGRTQYRPDGPPQVRILKRSDPSPGGNGLFQKRPEGASKPNKTYQEREAEYQEARLRIFGRTEVESELEKSKANSSFHTSHSSPALISSLSASDRPVMNHLHHPRPPQLTVVGPPLIPIPMPDPGPAFFIAPPPLMAVPPRTYNQAYPYHNYRKPELVTTSASTVPPRNWYPPRNGTPRVSVMRTPKGPDGSHGFRSCK